MRDLSQSKLLICFVNLLVVVVTRKCVGWEKKVLFWGESWVQGGGKGNVKKFFPSFIIELDSSFEKA